MKTKILIVTLAVACTCRCPAPVFTYNFTGINTTIPDANPGGTVNNQVLGTTDSLGSTLPVNPFIVNVAGVRLNIGGTGWNGDLYAYLRYENTAGTGFTTLLNRVGTTASPFNPIGFTTSGMDVWLSGSVSYTDIHNVSNPTAGATYRVDQTGSSITFDSFNNLDPTTGTWSLFVADLNGGHVSTLNGWSLSLEVVPEPTTWALLILLTAGGGRMAWRHFRNRRAPAALE